MRNIKNSMLSLRDFEVQAKKYLPRPIFAYISGGVEDNISRDNNLNVFASYSLRPDTMVDVSKRNIEVELFGHTYSAPVGIAPMGIAALSCFEGDIALAAAAHEKNVPFVMSGSSLIPLEEVAEACPEMWFQAYLPRTYEEIDKLVDRVKNAGIKTLVVTVDVPVKANRENNVRAGFSTPFRPSFSLAMEGISHPRWLFSTLAKTFIRRGMPHFENNNAARGAPLFSGNAVRDFSGRSHLTWEHIKHIRSRWPGIMIIKGILSCGDTLRCREAGIDGIVVSNHGGRQLDTSVSPIHVLPEIVDVAGDMVVMSDSGIRRGTDVIKSLAFGAKACLIGRPFNYACTVNGSSGVKHAIDLITSEVDRDLGMLGLQSLQQIDARHIWQR